MRSILPQRTSVGSDTTNVEDTDNQLPLGPRNLLLEQIGHNQLPLGPMNLLLEQIGHNQLPLGPRNLILEPIGHDQVSE